MSYATPRAFFLGVGDDAFTSECTLMALMTYIWADSNASSTIARFPLRITASLDFCPYGQTGTDSVRPSRGVNGTVTATETQMRQ
ncbi:hypothetical protein PGB90_000074 [Kerria lacca]